MHPLFEGLSPLQAIHEMAGEQPRIGKASEPEAGRNFESDIKRMDMAEGFEKGRKP